jgi:hypothetical protein
MVLSSETMEADWFGVHSRTPRRISPVERRRRLPMVSKVLVEDRMEATTSFDDSLARRL